MASEKVRSSYDKFGIVSSFLCIVHCTLLPVALALIANVNHPFSDYSHSLEILFLFISVGAVYFSSKNSHSLVIKVTLWLFLFVFIGGIVFENTLASGKTIGLIGSVGLMITHFFNIKSCKKC